jgi:1,4-dihydroxy-2-naphthoyl-CoA hydrolase
VSIWRNPLTVEVLNANGDGTMIRPLGIRFTEIGADFVRGTMPVDARTHQPYGLLHGGASVALAETLGSTGAGMCVDAAR